MLSFSQGVIPLTQNCNAHCLGCPLSGCETSHPIQFGDLISTHQFFKIYPKKTVMHLVGGNPLLNNELPIVLNFLIKNKIRPYVWTHAMGTPDLWQPLLPLISTLILFLPTSEPTTYKTTIGDWSWKAFETQFKWLSQRHAQIAITTHLHPGSLESLPDLHEWCKINRCPLILHYSPQNLDVELHGYITRYYRIPNVYVFQTPSHPKTLCLGFPYSGILDPWQLIKNVVKF